MKDLKRRTKIVCTIGPSTSSKDKIEELIRNGMDVARLNFSHGTHADHQKVIKYIREISESLNCSIPILMDLQGPKIRVGQMKDGAQMLKTGSQVTITPEKVTGTESLIPIDYENLVQDAEIGNTILMDDGLLELKIISRDTNNLTADVVVGGLLKSRKGVNLPNVKISIPALTKKDKEDLDFGLQQGVDYVALSFVRSAREVQDLISRIRARGSNAGVISKIEKPEAIAVIEEIIEESDGIMVARGDLGIEIASERVPLIQKKIIRLCRNAGKPVITATQMLESMIQNPRATRAESSDVANAVLDGTDAVMLSGETASGKYPLEAVKVMDKICRSVENQDAKLYNSLTFQKPEWKEKQIIESLSYSCVRISEYVDAKVIATITHSGTTARRIAKFRPEVPIIAFTESQDVLRQLNLVWGVSPVRISQIFNTDKSVQVMEEHLKKVGLVSANDRVIIATGMPIAKRGRTNMIKISTIT
ncbi:MAG TPA: pyruvate kinase [Balneolales bacterium]|nr:pyruvate kinase [Balneolales bacterium]